MVHTDFVNEKFKEFSEYWNLYIYHHQARGEIVLNQPWIYKLPRNVYTEFIFIGL